MGEGPPMCNILPGEPIGCLVWSANDNRIHDWKKGVTSEAAGSGKGLGPEAWGACSKQLPWLMCLAVVGTVSGHSEGVSPPCPRPVCWARRAGLCPSLSLVACGVSLTVNEKSVDSHLPPSTVHIVSATSCLLRRCGLCRFQIKLVKKVVLTLTMFMFYLPWRCEFQYRGFLSVSLWTLKSVKHIKKACQATET